MPHILKKTYVSVYIHPRLIKYVYALLLKINYNYKLREINRKKNKIKGKYSTAALL